MSLNNANNKKVLRIPLGVVSSDTLFKGMRINSKIQITAFQVVDPSGQSEDGTNFVRLQLKRDAVLLAEFSTESGNEGALAAGVWGDAPEPAASDLLAARDGDLDVNIDVEGSGALTAGSVAVIEYHEL